MRKTKRFIFKRPKRPLSLETEKRGMVSVVHGDAVKEQQQATPIHTFADPNCVK